eukprot:jgi/Chrzof1/11562/Cz06g00100.t1
MEVDEDSSAKITLELQTSTSTKAKGKRRSKQNIRRVKPLTSGIPGCSASATGLTDQQQLAACRALYQQLPKQSRYARHKLKVLDKAIELLSIQRVVSTDCVVVCLWAGLSSVAAAPRICNQQSIVFSIVSVDVDEHQHLFTRSVPHALHL